MSNLDNVYVSCPARMSDGRGNVTDWTSHNELLKKMKGSSTISYDFRARLQVSGLKDLENNKFNLCDKDPAGNVVLGEMKLNVNTSGSFLDAFAPLSKNSFFNKDRSLVSTQPNAAPITTPVVTRPIVTAPVMAPVVTAPVMAPIVTAPVMAPVVTAPVTAPITA